METGPAGAHYVYEKQATYVDNIDCTYVRAEVSHGPGGGYWKTYTTSRTGNCGADWSRPPGHIADKIDILVWTGAQCALCAATDWVFNPNQTAFWSIFTSSNVPPCGASCYGNHAWGYNWNGSWHGGVTWSGYHWLPT